MRQGNSNKRMRGRGGGGGGGGGGGNNGGRKGPNPLNRSYESAGPDNTKIRGTALHIAEKYVTLARDAQSSGDPVLAENFLQHAEHYYRIIAAAQANMPQAMPIVRSDIQVDEDEEDFDETQAEAPRAEGRGEPRPQVGDDGFMSVDAPQPFLDDIPVGDRPPREERPRLDRGDRPERGRGRFRNEPRGERGERSERPERAERSERGEPPARDGSRFEGPRPRRSERPQRAEARGEGEAEADLAALPAFLTAAPTRVVAPAPLDIETPVEAEAPAPVAEEAPKRRTRGGRGRGRRPDYEAGDKDPGEDAAPIVVED
jgi:hypothetical protein